MDMNLPREITVENQRQQVRSIVQLWALRMLVGMQGQHSHLYSRHLDLERLQAWLDLSIVTDELGGEADKKQVHAALERLHRELEQQAPAVPVELARNVGRLRELVGLSEVDSRLLEFAALLHTDALLESVANTLGDLSTRATSTCLAQLLKLPLVEVRESLGTRGALARSGLLTLSRGGQETLKDKLDIVSNQFAEKLVHSEIDVMQLMRDMVSPSSPGHLTLADFAHVRPTVDVLATYLQGALATGRTGVNVLIYGQPGVGKNQLVKAIAQSLGVDLFEVASEDEDGDPISGNRRLRAYRASQNFFGCQQSLILFDEVEDVFHGTSEDSPFAGRTTPHVRKAWINRMLEGNAVPTFWLTNLVECLDAAFIRRFDVVLELTVPPRRQREQIIREACQGLLDEPAVARMAESQVLTPGVVTRAAAVVRSLGEPPAAGATAAVQRLIDNTLRAQGHEALGMSGPEAQASFYDPQVANTGADLQRIAAGLARTGEGRLCFYGPPGTGKTACARWLARELGRPAMVVRASDLMSKWVGDNERNIARVFRQAQDDGAVLVIDEVDSFLQNRREARQNWEVTLVNEMLTQMESHSGIFIASTNLMDGFDPAALRRFDLKLRFDALRPEQALALCLQHCAALGLPEPDTASRQRLEALKQLTPGDFTAVVRQHRFSPFGSVIDLVAALEGECALKQPGRHPIGFVH